MAKGAQKLWPCADLTGETFGKLKVVGLHHRDPKTRHRFWLCECECGKRKVIMHTNLKVGTRSCGCVSKAEWRKIRSWDFDIHRRW